MTSATRRFTIRTGFSAKDIVTTFPADAGPRLEAHEVFSRQVEIMVRQARRGSIVAVLGVAFIGALLLPAVGPSRVALWGGLVVTAVTIRTAALLYIHRTRETEAVLGERVLTACTVLLGFAVSSAAFLFFPPASFEIRALVTLILCAWAAGGGAVLGPHPRSYYWYLASYFPVLAITWLVYEPGYPIVVVLLGLFAYVLVFLGKEIGRLVVLSASLEKQKDALIAEKDSLLLDKDLLLSEKDLLIAELHTARRLSDEANASKSRFLAAASHDLRQPVTALSLLAGALVGTPLDSRGTEIANQIVHAIDSLERLFNALLDLSRLEAGVVVPRPTGFDLAALAQTVAEEFRPRAPKGLTLVTDLSKAYVRTDRVMIEQILRNLLENALKFTAEAMSESRQTATITIRIVRLAHGCELQVSDTGPGIPADEQENIFAEFYQLNSSSGTRQGLGLGLAISRMTARLLNVEVRVRSKVGEGATFFIAFPERLFASGPSDSKPAVAMGRLDLGGRVVVVIDDDVAVREATRVVLLSWNAIPVVAANVATAVSMLRASGLPPSLLLVDYQLERGVLGSEAIAAIQKVHPHVPALVMTGTTVSANLSAGFRVLQKPISYATLATEVLHALPAVQSDT
jgi:signal transduction histidine kinase/CheY-like chemotaxis protein